MAGNIKGITIEIGGNTTKLQSALSGVNKNIKNTGFALRDINKLLKLDPKNVELLRQKQENLKTAIQGTKEKLDTERKALEQLKSADQTPEVVRQQQELQRAIIEDEQRLKSLENEFRSFGSVAKQQMIAVGESIKQAGARITEFGDKIAGVGRTMTTRVTAPIVGVMGAAVKVTADFDSSMSQVAATMGKTMDEINSEVATVNTSTGEFTGTLREFAQEMGKNTAFSATEAAEALNYMALAGYDAETSMTMLPTVLDLAAAGGMDLASASDMVTDAQSALGLSLEDTASMVDQMAMASSKSNTSVAQLGEAFLKIGATGRNVAGGTQELATVLGVLADNGIKGAEGGTHLRNMLLSLQQASKDGAVDFGEFSVQLYDTDGNMRSMIDVIGEMQDGMNGMTQESIDAITSGIFNKTDLAAVNALLGTSKKRFAELGKEIGDSTGSASKMAATQLDNLQGQMTLLKSAMEGVAIQIGDILMPKIREVVGVIQEWVQKFSELDASTKETIVKIALVAAAIGPVLVLAGTAISVIGRVVSGVGSLIQVLAGLASPIGIVVVAIGALVAAFTYLYTSNEEFRNKVNEVFEAVREKITAVIEQLKVIFESFKELCATIWAEWGDSIMNTVQTIFGAIADVISGVLTVVQGIIQTALAVIKGDWQGAWNGIKTILSGALEAIKGAITLAFTLIRTTIGTIMAAIQAVISTVWNAIKALVSAALNSIKSTVSSVMNSIKSTFSSVWNAIKSTVSTVVNAIKSTISTGLNAVKSTVSSILNGIKSTFTTVFDGIKSHVKGVVDWLKKVFDFKWELPKIKLPHFSISGGFSLNPPSIPSFSVDWYKKAYGKALAFTSPTVLPTPSGLKGFGDGNGAEIVIGENKLMSSINKAAGAAETSAKLDLVTELLIEYLPELANTKIYMDKNALVGEIAPAMNRQLGIAFRG